MKIEVLTNEIEVLAKKIEVKIEILTDQKMEVLTN